MVFWYGHDDKDKNLYVFDPKALHHILIKDQDIFEETAFFIECVRVLVQSWLNNRRLIMPRRNRVIFGLGLLSTTGIDIALLLLNILTSSEGAHHREQRKLINPVFSTAHLRDMVPIFYNVTYKVSLSLDHLLPPHGFLLTPILHFGQLRDILVRQLREGPREIDMLAWIARTSLEIIGEAGLGK
jgi:hypothetical protein